MTDVSDFIVDHRASDRVLVLGMSPAKKNVPFKNCSLYRLGRWMKAVSQEEWSFHNVIPAVHGSADMCDVDPQALYDAVNGKEKVIALGTFVSRVCSKYGIDHHRIHHPSPRNRSLNDPRVERVMLYRLRKYLLK